MYLSCEPSTVKLRLSSCNQGRVWLSPHVSSYQHVQTVIERPVVCELAVLSESTRSSGVFLDSALARSHSGELGQAEAGLSTLH